MIVCGAACGYCGRCTSAGERDDWPDDDRADVCIVCGVDVDPGRLFCGSDCAAEYAGDTAADEAYETWRDEQ